MASRAILSNSFEEHRTQNHPQYLSGFSRTLFPDNLSQNSCIHKRKRCISDKGSIFRLPSLLCTINKNRQRVKFGGGQVTAGLYNATTECYRDIQWSSRELNKQRRYPASRGPSILLRRSKGIIIAGYNDGDGYIKTSPKK